MRLNDGYNTNTNVVSLSQVYTTGNMGWPLYFHRSDRIGDRLHQKLCLDYNHHYISSNWNYHQQHNQGISSSLHHDFH